MKLMRDAILSLATLLLAANVALAQGTQQGGPNAGAGQTTGKAGTAPQAGPDKEVDLPVAKPKSPAAQDQPKKEEKKDKDTTTDVPQLYGTPIKSENNTIFYVLDISGSMGWDTAQYTRPDGSTSKGCRLDRAKAELTKSVMSLPENFKFNMLSYDCSVYMWQGSMVQANATNKQAAAAWINSQQPQGGTGTGPATAAGLAPKENKLVVLLTDGQPNCGAGGDDWWADDQTLCNTHRQMIRGANTQGAVINVYGIGASGIFKEFCQNVAGDNGGTYTDVR